MPFYRSRYNNNIVEAFVYTGAHNREFLLYWVAKYGGNMVVKRPWHLWKQQDEYLLIKSRGGQRVDKMDWIIRGLDGKESTFDAWSHELFDRDFKEDPTISENLPKDRVGEKVLLSAANIWFKPPQSNNDECWIQTLTGNKFSLTNPSVDHIIDTEIAFCLAKKCRFSGHCIGFYSVAQHSVLVCDLVKTPELKLPALLHDAHEIYTGFGDVCRPAKKLNKEVGYFLDWHTKKIDAVIAEKFGFDPELFYHEEIKYADSQALSTEARDIMSKAPAEWANMPPASNKHEVKVMNYGDAAILFMEKLNNLTGIN